MNWLQGEKQDLKLDTFDDRQPVKFGRSAVVIWQNLLRSGARPAAAFCNLCNFEIWRCVRPYIRLRPVAGIFHGGGGGGGAFPKNLDQISNLNYTLRNFWRHTGAECPTCGVFKLKSGKF